MGRFTIHTATPEHIPEMVDVCAAAFAEDPVVSNLEKNVEPTLKRRHNIEWWQDQWAHASLNGCHGHIIRDEEASGKIVACSKWQKPLELTEAEKAEKAAWQEAKWKEPMVEGANVELCKAFFGQLREGQAKNVNPETDWFLHILCVLPSHHRLGLGGMLIKLGLDEADRAGASTYIEASAKGLPLYLRWGWVPLDFTLTFDMAEFGCEGGVIVQKTLMRPPHPVSSSETASIGAVMENEAVVG